MFDSNDPRLTAYVLGELDDASRVELEAEMERTPELRRALEEFRRAADYLREAFHSEPAPALTEAQRASIQTAAGEAVGSEGGSSTLATADAAPAVLKLAPAAGRGPRWLIALVTVAAAALIGFVGVAGWKVYSNPDGPFMVAKNESSPSAALAPQKSDAESPASSTSPASEPAPNRGVGHDRADVELRIGDADERQSSSERGGGLGANEFQGDGFGSGRATASGSRYYDEATNGSGPAPGMGGAVHRGAMGMGAGSMSGMGGNPYGGGGGMGPGMAGGSPGGVGGGGGIPSDEGPGIVTGLDPSGNIDANGSFTIRKPEYENASPGSAGQRNLYSFSENAEDAPESAPAAETPAPQRTDLATNNPLPADPRGAGGLPGPPEIPRGMPAGLTKHIVPSLASRPASPREESLEGRPDSELALLPAQQPAEPAPAAPPVVTAPRAAVAAADDSTPEMREEVEPLGERSKEGGGQEGQADPQDRAARPSAGEDRLKTGNGESLDVLQQAQKDAAPADKNESQPAGDTTRENKKNAPVTRTWRRVNAVPNASRLMIGDRDELPLEGMQANVTIDGFRARVILDLYFYNNRGQQLEGDFKLRLPNDASLYYFAFGESAFEYRPMVDQLASRDFLPPEMLRGSGTGPDDISRLRGDTWTKVKEARIVPREKAAHAYSETVRRRVDPALVEWAGAGVFNARVFPLLPNKLHHIVVGYDVNLTQDGKALNYALDLPPDLSEVRVDLNLAAVPGAAAHVNPSTRPFLVSGRAYYHLEGPWTEPLKVRIDTADTIVLQGQDSQKNEFFATRITPPLPAEEAAAGSPSAIFLVDTSLSSNPDKFNVWLKLLETTLTKNRDSMQRFAVLFFNVESHWWQEKYVENNSKNVEYLLEYCHTLALEGATDLRQALAAAATPSWTEKSTEAPAAPDLFLLSDGAVTWGEQNLHLLAESLRSGKSGALFAYQTGLTGTAVGVLEHLARESGGAVFSVAHEEEIEKAATAHRQRPWRLVSVDVPGGSDLLIAGRPKSIYPGQSLELVGRGQAGSEAIVRVARGDGEETLRVPLGEAVASDATARLYGQVAVGQLEDLGPAVEDVAVAYARHFRVTGQTCSLLMLENEADYQRFNIRPEDDAFVVKSSAAASVISNKIDELGDSLADPKKSLQLWLAKMERTPGVQFQLSTAMKLALERLPAKAFAVAAPPLVCQERAKGEIPQTVLDQLQTGQLEYDVIAAEAQRRFEARGAADALKALSSLVETNPGDPTLARDVAFSAMEWGLGGQAYWLLRRVADARPYEPQVYQALGQCAAETGNPDLAIVYYEVALGGHWHERYQELDRIAAVEYLHLLRRIDRGELTSEIPDYARARLESLVQKAGVDKADVLVTMMWNTDRTDVDLHVTEPNGEECYYKNRNTGAGGEITRDVTEGYGPEMYYMKTAPHGKFAIKADYYGADANRTTVRTKVYLTIYEDFGGRKEHVTRKTVPLSHNKELREVAEVFVEKQ